jgi:tetratricopeptide (TPR) repeat protein
LLGDVHFAKNDIGKALKAYQKAIDLDKSIYEVWLQMMICLRVSGDIEGLRSFSNKAIDYYPNQSGPYYYHALALFQLESFTQAAEYAEEAAFMSSSKSADYEDIVILQSRIAQKQGKVNDATEMLSNLHSSIGESSESLELLGDLMKMKDDKSLAEKYWKKAIEKGGNKERINQKLQSI